MHPAAVADGVAEGAEAEGDADGDGGLGDGEGEGLAVALGEGETETRGEPGWFEEPHPTTSRTMTASDTTSRPTRATEALRLAGIQTSVRRHVARSGDQSTCPAPDDDSASGVTNAVVD